MEHDSQSTIDATPTSAADPAAGGPAPASDRYEREIDLDSESTHARVVRLVGTDRRVLELGPAAGHMTRALRDRGCTVVGIEQDQRMGEAAARYCERVIVGDLDELDLDAELGSDRFNVIVAADVLEHLKDPLAALLRLRKFLGPDGFFVLSLPNVAHGSVRIALLQGHFDYQSIGLLDRTHLRFFTRESIGRLLDEAELAVAEIFHQQLNIEASEVPFDVGSVPAEVLDELARDPEARTYQFVIKAVALDAPGLRDVQRRLRDLAHENAELRERAAETLASTAGREDQLRTALIQAHDRALRRDEDIHALQEELKAVRAKLEAAGRSYQDAQATATALSVRLERIAHSPPVRAYTMLTTLPGFSGLRAMRTARYQQAVRDAAARAVPPSG